MHMDSKGKNNGKTKVFHTVRSVQFVQQLTLLDLSYL